MAFLLADPLFFQVIFCFLVEQNLEAKKTAEQIGQNFFEGSFLDFPCAGGLEWAAARKDPFVPV